MKSLIHRTFAQLPREYYIRQFCFGLIFPIIVIGFAFYHSANTNQNLSPDPIKILVFILNTLLYPYSRFLYERLVRFIQGDNIFVFNLVLVMFVKMFTMLLCWGMAVYLAPIALIYLYLQSSKIAGGVGES